MSYAFKPLEWTHNTNIYEVNLRQYTQEGTFNAFARELPRLKEMGVQTLWFMPITPIAQKRMKGTMGSYYACSDYTSVGEEFGTLDDFKQLVKQSHEMGFKVIIDWVANHTGWDHTWTKTNPAFYKHDEQTHDFRTASGMDDIIELDYDNPEMVAAMIAAMKFWITECDIDGFRCDLAFWVTLEFWKKARTELDAVKPLFWLGELDSLERPEYMGTFDTAYTWEWMHKTAAYYQQQIPFSTLVEILKRYDAQGDATMRAWFTSNHDENSWNGTEYEKYGHIAKALAVFSCTWNGLPLIYSGQELPNRKRLMFFDKDVIEWTGHNELHEFYKTLLTLQHTHPALRAGDVHTGTHIISDDENAFVYLRRSADREVLVFLNFSKQETRFAITYYELQGVFKNIFTGEELEITGQFSILLMPGDYYVFVR